LTGQNIVQKIGRYLENILCQTLIPVMTAVTYTTKVILLIILVRGIRFVGTALMNITDYINERK
tara:strand:- start:547 stop:738 length:192 start_codon:yes stop_codon:yes gene_type:complete